VEREARVVERDARGLASLPEWLLDLPEADLAPELVAEGTHRPGVDRPVAAVEQDRVGPPIARRLQHVTLEAGAVDAVAVAATRPSHVDEEREPGVGRQDPNVCVLALERASQQEGDVAG